MQKLTKEQAAVIGAYTGMAAGPFGDIQEYAERVLGHPCWTHEFGDKEFMKKLREAALSDFIAICHDGDS